MSEQNHSVALSALPGEGDVVVVTKTRCRHECRECGEPATKKHSYLLEGGRRNPASSAYGHDDCSYCEDEFAFTCDAHERDGRRAPDGYTWCSTFTANKSFAHMFLYWHEEKNHPSISKAERVA